MAYALSHYVETLFPPRRLPPKAVVFVSAYRRHSFDEDHFLHLTDVGREVAEKIYERHCFFTEQRKHIGSFLLLCFITGQLPVDCLFSNIHKIGINAGLLHQLLMCTSLDNSAVCNNNNLLGIAKDTPIIILDEATSSVDPENEAELQQAIEKLTEDKTVIIIAHRLKTVRNAQQIVVIANGG